VITSLGLQHFKNFVDAKLHLGPLTVTVGTNASGKSNLRDAFRFLHGVSRGYTLSEIIGEKWIEGGVLQWKGIRGGTQEVAYHAQETFGIRIETKLEKRKVTYEIVVNVGSNGRPPRVERERLWQWSSMLFDSHPSDDPPDQGTDPTYIFVRLPRDNRNRKHGKRLQFLSHQPVLSQIIEKKDATKAVRDSAEELLDGLSSMRFLDLSPDAMRIPSLPGQQILGDRGENLSSVLQEICQTERSKAAMIGWIRELTPLDVTDFNFVPDQTGKILVTLVESDGSRTSAYSASDGTLRFLAMIAALLGPSPAHFYFYEELENGIHPTRLHLLLELIEQKVRDGAIQIVATSHSPQLLAFLSEESRRNASLVYRLEDAPDARIQRIFDIPNAEELLRKSDLSKLHATGWLEDAVAFLDNSGEPSEGEKK